MSKVTGIVLAAGQGSRMGSKIPKQYLEIGERPILVHTLELFEQTHLIDRIVLVVGNQEVEPAKEILSRFQLRKVAAVVTGGSERSHSVYHGLQLVPEDCSWVVVHDGVRPFFTPDLLERVLKAAEETGAAVPGVPVKDTIKICDDAGKVITTPPRKNLWAIQTPQAFRKDWLLEAYAEAMAKNLVATDDAGLLEQLGKPVQVVQGDYENIKLTTPEDYDLAQAIWERRQGQCG
ncbi:MAG: 2-C-methyl-D-erythritol 4-phosphate cytidylyltransferase [Clostridia bacterium]|nr:2-C-methyl-D-erythritol 4-phosphate cytidylyltransferase [Clostridia bacterium]